MLPRARTAEGLAASAAHVEALVAAEAAAGVPPSRCVVAGFSQGGAIALMMLRSATQLAGVVGLSTYLPLRSQPGVVSEANKTTPVFMGSGTSDQVVAYQWSKSSVDALAAAGVSDMTWRSYPGMGHSACPQELQDVATFLKKVLPPLPA